ncbi:melatonin receptor type 1A-like [Paramacrobiotus metropolitanus]|uniref:melatonin receptor type 1A-like n=1 Tax=Paramacrobiotus metropolitanus TaxID=2943436 RepID=UPI002445EB7B|nr:melatonin receptor type 1A-like [Paramacrobiotus metropolitanus]
MSWNYYVSNTDNLNITNTTNASSVTIPGKWLKPWAAVYLSFCFEGALGNLLIVCVILFNRKLRSGCGLLIANCLIAYTILCGFSFPIVGTSVYRKQAFNWQLDPKYCKGFQWIQMGCRFAAYWLDLYIAVNRVVALCFPHRYRAFSRTRTEMTVVAILWITALMYSGLGWFDLGMHFAWIPIGTCAGLPYGYLGTFVYMTGFYIPGVVTAGMYVFIYGKILSRKHQIDPERSSTEDNKQKQTRQKRIITTNMMCVSFVCTSACSMILPVMISFIKVTENDVHYPIVVIWLAVAQLLGYATNPVKSNYSL